MTWIHSLALCVLFTICVLVLIAGIPPGPHAPIFKVHKVKTVEVKP